MRQVSEPAALLIFGYGNPSRGDDALGPQLLETLERQLPHAVREAAGGIELLTDFQLQIEHALDLAGRRLVLFADAHAACPAPFILSALQPAANPGYSTHAIDPATVLHCYSDILRAPPPPCFLLGIRGHRFELGEPLSAGAQANLNAAAALVLDLCRRPDPGWWYSACRDGRTDEPGPEGNGVSQEAAAPARS